MTRLPLLALAFALDLVVGCASTPVANGGAVADDADDDRVNVARTQLEGLATRAVAFETEHGRCITAVTDLEQPAPVDPWGNAVAFMPASEAGPTALVSAGPDGTLLSDDDISVRVTCMGG